MRSTAQIKGHPIHPILVAFPIAFGVGARSPTSPGCSARGRHCGRPGRTSRRAP